MDNQLRQPYEGQLIKFTNVVKGWQARWFILHPESGLLEYYLVSFSIVFFYLYGPIYPNISFSNHFELKFNLLVLLHYKEFYHQFVKILVQIIKKV